jgi:hypothetical protein
MTTHPSNIISYEAFKYIHIQRCKKTSSLALRRSKDDVLNCVILIGCSLLRCWGFNFHVPNLFRLIDWRDSDFLIHFVRDFRLC